MEVIKQNEQYTLNKVLENGWIIEGSATKRVSGDLSFWLQILKRESVEGLEKEDTIGDISYSTNLEGRFDMSCSTTEANRSQLMSCIDSIVDEVLNYFK